MWDVSPSIVKTFSVTLGGAGMAGGLHGSQRGGYLVWAPPDSITKVLKIEDQYSVVTRF